MSSPRHQDTENRGIDWLGIARIMMLQVLVLLALAGAFIRYLNWSSDAAWAEFSAASKSELSQARPYPRSAVGSGCQAPAVLRSQRLRET
jgi:hypothetical protein